MLASLNSPPPSILGSHSGELIALVYHLLLLELVFLRGLRHDCVYKFQFPYHHAKMGASVSKMMGKIFGTKEMRILMLGLDAAGKTSKWTAP